MFSFILGGACWNSCGKLINDMEKLNQTQFLSALGLHISKRFGTVISAWSCKYYRQIEDPMAWQLLIRSSQSNKSEEQYNNDNYDNNNNNNNNDNNNRG
jgi:hypothetical protein